MQPQMNKTDGAPFRAYVPFLVANLEDADAVVRETAKKAVVELFRCAVTPHSRKAVNARPG